MQIGDNFPPGGTWRLGNWLGHSWRLGLMVTLLALTCWEVKPAHLQATDNDTVQPGASVSVVVAKPGDTG